MNEQSMQDANSALDTVAYGENALHVSGVYKVLVSHDEAGYEVYNTYTKVVEVVSTLLPEAMQYSEQLNAHWEENPPSSLEVMPKIHVSDAIIMPAGHG